MADYLIVYQGGNQDWTKKPAEQIRPVMEQWERPLAPDRVDRAVARGREQPGGRVVGDAGARPGPERRDERLLEDVLREQEVARAEEARQHGDQAARFAAKQGFELRFDHPRRSPRTRPKGSVPTQPRPSSAAVVA